MNKLLRIAARDRKRSKHDPTPPEPDPNPGTSGVIAKFGFVTDLHYGLIQNYAGRRPQEGPQKLTQAINYFNTQDLNFVIQLGDFVDAGHEGLTATIRTEAQALTDLQTIEAVYDDCIHPRYYCFGNHDTDKMSKATFIANTGMTSKYYYFDVGSVRFIVLDACYLSDNDSSDHDTGNNDPDDHLTDWIPPTQRTWLTNTLAAATGKCVVFCHQGLDRTHDLSVNNANVVRGILEASGKVIAVLTGHEHVNRSATVNGIPYYSMQAITAGVYPLGAYCRVNVHDSFITIEGFAGQTSYSPTSIPTIPDGLEHFTVDGWETAVFNGVSTNVAFYSGKLRPSYDPSGVTTLEGRKDMYWVYNYGGKKWIKLKVPIWPTYPSPYRAEFTRWPLYSKHALGTEEWHGWSYVLPETMDGVTTKIQGTEMSIYQCHQGSIGLTGQTSTPPAMQMSLAYPGELNSSTPHRKTPDGWEVIISQNCRAVDGSNYRWSPQGSAVKLVPGGRLDIVQHIVYGVGINGMRRIWFNGVEYVPPAFTTSGKFFPGGIYGSTVYENQFDPATGLQFGGNTKWGLYHSQLKYEFGSKSHATISAIPGNTMFGILMSDFKQLIRYPSDSNYLEDAYEFVTTENF